MNNFSETLVGWYKLNKRDLPWRFTKNPYKVWLSEIILQQTRVAQGLPYYLKFLKLFPTVEHLAKAEEQEVLNTWKGLGYYSRARNMHKSAQMIAFDYDGDFPSNFESLKKLKGVGDYTAAAIASFCYREPVAVVDGNVYRVLSRVFGIETPIDTPAGKKEFDALADTLLDIHNPDEHNQAIMEFGALHCLPKNPDCENCIFSNNCEAFSQKKVGDLPIKSKKIKRRSRYFNYLVIKNGEKYAVERRDEKDIWANMNEFPLIESSKEVLGESELLVLLEKEYGVQTEVTLQQASKKHVLSHQDIFYSFWKVQLSKEQQEKYTFYSLKAMNEMPFPKLLETYISNI